MGMHQERSVIVTNKLMGICEKLRIFTFSPLMIMIWLCSYQGGRTSEAFLGYLHEKVAADKGFARIGSLDTLARDFLAAADKTGAAAALKTAAEKLDEASRAAGMLYSKFAEKAATKVSISRNVSMWCFHVILR